MINYKEKILVVDDDANIRQILEARLTISGYIVLLANDGEEALKVFRKESPDLIILDIMLPKIGGYEVCKELRKGSSVPIIMLTALGDISDRVMGLEFGADDYVLKPFSPKELEARVRSVLRRIKKPPEAKILHENQLLQIGNLMVSEVVQVLLL